MTSSGRIGGDLSYLAIYNTRTSFRFIRRLEAPIVAGDVIGEMTYTPQDGGQTIIYEWSLPEISTGVTRLFPLWKKSSLCQRPNPFPAL